MEKKYQINQTTDPEIYNYEMIALKVQHGNFFYLVVEVPFGHYTFKEAMSKIYNKILQHEIQKQNLKIQNNQVSLA